jgi:hypothetical protein
MLVKAFRVTEMDVKRAQMLAIFVEITILLCFKNAMVNDLSRGSINM